MDNELTDSAEKEIAAIEGVGSMTDSKLANKSNNILRLK